MKNLVIKTKGAFFNLNSDICPVGANPYTDRAGSPAIKERQLFISLFRPAGD